MRNHFIVLDAEGFSIFKDANCEIPQRFATLAAADKLATELASANPGKDIFVYRVALIWKRPRKEAAVNQKIVTVKP